MSEQLKPCPFCGSAKIEHVGVEVIHSLTCHECGAGVGLYPTEAQAAEAWNRRAGPCEELFRKIKQEVESGQIEPEAQGNG